MYHTLIISYNHKIVNRNVKIFPKYNMIAYSCNEKIKNANFHSLRTRATAIRSLQHYQDVLYQRGVEKLAQLNIKESINAEVDVSVLRYIIDFDLGDICEIANSDIGLTWTARITLSSR